MKRVIFEQDELNNRKYILREEYVGYGIYEEKCPSGYMLNQSYLVDNGTYRVVIQPYMHMCYDEVLCLIDSMKFEKTIDIPSIRRGNTFILHKQGKVYTLD